MQSLRQVTKSEEWSSPRWESQRSSPASMVRESLQKSKREKSKTEQQFKTKRGECPSKQFVNLCSNIEDDSTKEKKTIYVSPPQRNDNNEIPMEENILDIVESSGVKIEGMQEDIVELQPKENERCKTAPPLEEEIEGSDSRTNPFEEVENDTMQPCIEVKDDDTIQPCNKLNVELAGVQTLIVHADEDGVEIHEDYLAPNECHEGVSLSLIIDGVGCTDATSYTSVGMLIVPTLEYSRPYELQLFEDDCERWFLYAPFYICPDSRTNRFKEGENDTIRTSSKTKNWKKRKQVRLMEPSVLGLKNKGLNQAFEEFVVWNWKKRKRRIRWKSRIPCIRDSRLFWQSLPFES